MGDSVYALGILTGLSFLFSLSLTPLVRRVAIRMSVIDKPDGSRKLQTGPIARLGGVAVLAGYGLAYAVFLSTPLAAPEHYMQVVWRTAPALIVVFVTGLLDDVRNLKPMQKLGGQLLAALIAYASGVRILAFHGTAWAVWWSLPITVLWLILCTNAFNLIDGLDGLAAGLGLFAAVTMVISAGVNGNLGLAFATAPLVGSLLAFLRYNFNPASIYLGDCGSLVIGFMLGCCGVVWSQKSVAVIGIAAPLMALSVPLLDTMLAITRRFLRRQPIFYPDRGHIHHKLIDRGLTPRRAVLLLYGVASIVTIFSLLQEMIRREFAPLVLAAFCGIAIAGIRLLKIAEFDIVGELLRDGAFRRAIDAHIALRRTDTEFSTCTDLTDMWETICRAAQSFEFVHVTLTVDAMTLERQFRDISPSECWTIKVDLGEHNSILFRHNWPHAGPDMIGSFIEIVCKRLRSKPALKPLLSKSMAASG
jgi:UDP-GlcNAc:undecaprenyl-phosphate GlcNAc-1-phosphate transferase